MTIICVTGYNLRWSLRNVTVLSYKRKTGICYCPNKLAHLAFQRYSSSQGNQLLSIQIMRLGLPSVGHSRELYCTILVINIQSNLGCRTTLISNKSVPEQANWQPGTWDARRESVSYVTASAQCSLLLYILSIYCVYSFCLRFYVYAFSLVLYKILCMRYCYKGLNKQSSGVRRSWLRHYATSLKVAGSNPDEVIRFFSIALWPWGRLSL
jgi:hypothetical protein